MRLTVYEIHFETKIVCIAKLKAAPQTEIPTESSISNRLKRGNFRLLTQLGTPETGHYRGADLPLPFNEF